MTRMKRVTKMSPCSPKCLARASFLPPYTPCALRATCHMQGSSLEDYLKAAVMLAYNYGTVGYPDLKTLILCVCTPIHLSPNPALSLPLHAATPSLSLPLHAATPSLSLPLHAATPSLSLPLHAATPSLSLPLHAATPSHLHFSFLCSFIDSFIDSFEGISGWRHVFDAIFVLERVLSFSHGWPNMDEVPRFQQVSFRLFLLASLPTNVPRSLGFPSA